jgi:hypothetical protein
VVFPSEDFFKNALSNASNPWRLIEIAADNNDENIIQSAAGII